MGSNAPVIIPIGTSDPIDLSEGLPLFPGLGTARAGISAATRSYKLFEIPILLVCTRLKLAVYAGYGVGAVGPAVAFLSRNVTVARQNNGSEGQLTLTFNDGLRMQAGAFLGAYVSVGVTATLQVYLPRPWYKVWAFTWQNVFTIKEDIQVDFFALLLKLIQYLQTKKPNAGSFTEDRENKLLRTNLGVKGFGLEGSGSGVTSNLRATPDVTVSLNLANFVPKLKTINQALAKVDGEISFGPSAHLQFPVTLNIDGFYVEGGILDADQAFYERDVQYRNGNQVTAKGDTPFNLRENPSHFTTLVSYQTSVRLALSINAHVKVAKFFRIGANTPSLDLLRLLGRPASIGTVEIESAVTTAVGGGCVLTPNMTLRFEGPTGLEILTGDLAKGTVTLAGFQSSSDATIALEIRPAVANFPSSVTIPAGFQSALFPFTFQNQCLATGNPNNPSEMAPPSAISPLQTYRVTARLMQAPQNPCWDYQAETPLSITNRFIRCQRFGNTPEGPAPTWDPLASATIKADIDDPNAPTGGFLISAVLWFPYVANEETQTVPVTFTLQDEKGQPYGRSDVEVIGAAGRGFLAPSCTLNVTLLRQEQARNAPNPSISIHWNSKGQPSGYSNRFHLIANAGCQYGQSEFWLDVFNWS